MQVVQPDHWFEFKNQICDTLMTQKKDHELDIATSHHSNKSV